ncbi:hypothetical protein RHGRI_028305 [Rhododendron griersonianum]|uniref:CLAVATA3/ESR (CLE)-related protein 25 n=1 Tax=Rhododendron griersonianum TaxID=479676 RepID=A0AAV6IK03_9ERIC|nr:hypothetical protein RHGRI_028305 [Rhododendron griersonianum]
MGGRGRVLRASLGAVLFMAFSWFLFVGVLAHRGIKKTTITSKSSELLKLIGTERHGVQFDCDPYYVSKRRVPNGPNPIHNSTRFCAGEQGRIEHPLVEFKLHEDRGFRTLYRRLMASHLSENE